MGDKTVCRRSSIFVFGTPHTQQQWLEQLGTTSLQDAVRDGSHGIVKAYTLTVHPKKTNGRWFSLSWNNDLENVIRLRGTASKEQLEALRDLTHWRTELLGNKDDSSILVKDLLRNLEPMKGDSEGEVQKWSRHIPEHLQQRLTWLSTGDCQAHCRKKGVTLVQENNLTFLGSLRNAHNLGISTFWDVRDLVPCHGGKHGESCFYALKDQRRVIETPDGSTWFESCLYPRSEELETDECLEPIISRSNGHVSRNRLTVYTVCSDEESGPLSWYKEFMTMVRAIRSLSEIALHPVSVAYYGKDLHSPGFCDKRLEDLISARNMLLRQHSSNTKTDGPVIEHPSA